MPTKAYILIETDVGKSREVASNLREVRGVTTVDAVNRPIRPHHGRRGPRPERSRRHGHQPDPHDQRYRPDGYLSLDRRVLSTRLERPGAADLDTTRPAHSASLREIEGLPRGQAV